MLVVNKHAFHLEEIKYKLMKGITSTNSKNTQYNYCIWEYLE